MGRRKEAPRPVATGKASLLHYFSSSPSKRTSSSTPASSSPAVPGRANRAISTPLDPDPTAGSGIASTSAGARPPSRTSLRATQSLGSLETGAAVPGALSRLAPPASTLQLDRPNGSAATGEDAVPFRSPRHTVIPPLPGESEDEYEPPERIKSESVTPRRNPRRAAAAASSPLVQRSSPLVVERSDPKDAEDGSEAREGGGADLASELIKKVKIEASPRSPSSRTISLISPASSRRSRPKRIFSYVTDADGRKMVDLTRSSPSVAGSAASDSSDDPIVVSCKPADLARSWANSSSQTPSKKLKTEPSAPGALDTPRASRPHVTRAEGPLEPASDPRQHTTPRRSASRDHALSLARNMTPRGAARDPQSLTTPAARTPVRSQAGSSQAASATLASISPRILLNRSSQTEAGPSFVSGVAHVSAGREPDHAAGATAATDSEEFDAAATVSIAGHSASAGIQTSSGFRIGQVRLTDSALRRYSAQESARPPTSDSRYIRSPSGSPLSSLAPTPLRSKGPKPLSTSRTGGHGKRTQSFEIVIPLHRGSTAKKLKLASAASTSKAGSTTSSVKASQSDRAAAEARRKERDARMARAFEDSAEEESDREGSPSPAKRRKVTPQPEEADDESAGSSNSSSMSASDSEDEELTSFLARAKARREAGETIRSTAATSPSATTAPTTVSPPTDPAGEEKTRRSSRARRETDHYVPGAALKNAVKSGSAAREKRPAGLFQGQQASDLSGAAFEKMMRERKLTEQKGHTREWYAKFHNDLLSSDEDMGSDDDGDDGRSDGGRKRSSALAGVAGGTTDGLAAAFAAGSDDELALPNSVKSAALSKAQTAGKLIDEERLREAAQGGEGLEAGIERQGRTVWTAKTRRLRSVSATVADWHADGWLGRIAEALHTIIVQPEKPTSPIVLFSKLSVPALEIAPADLVQAISWNIETICHPSTTETAAQPLLALLSRLLQTPTAESSASGVTRQQLLDPLLRAGLTISIRVHESNGDSGLRLSPREVGDLPDQDDDLEEQVIVGEVERFRITQRWCTVLQTLLHIKSSLLSSGLLADAAGALIRLSLDPSAAPLRSKLRHALRMCLAKVYGCPEAVTDLWFYMLDTYRGSRPSLQLAMLQVLPHASESDKRFRRWLAWALLSTDQGLNEISLPIPLDEPVLPRIRSMLATTSVDGVFTPVNGSAPDVIADTRLIDRSKILMLSLSSMSYELYDHENRASLRRDLDAIIKSIQIIDGRFRADARKGLAVERLLAKNFLTALTHSLTYQLRAARGQKAGSDLTEEEQRHLLGGSRPKDRGPDPAGQDPKQPRLSFARMPQGATRSEPVNASSMGLMAADQVVSDISDDES